jgi:hypothetical protein
VFPRLLFWLTVSVAGILIVSVGAAPLLDDPQADAASSSRLVTVFARDAAVRRTAIASALGLLVTAYVFFWPSARTRLRLPRKSSKAKSPPTHMLGA